MPLSAQPRAQPEKSPGRRSVTMDQHRYTLEEESEDAVRPSPDRAPHPTTKSAIRSVRICTSYWQLLATQVRKAMGSV